jgi:uncharacterized protein (TIGR03435 family)
VKAAALALFCAITINAQTPAFEAASIHLSAGDETGGQLGYPPGRFTVENCTLSFIIQEIYGLREFQLVGGPKWISNRNFDITAEAASPVGDDQLRLMAQTLLANRFHLRVHREMRPLPVYALIVGKNGPKLHASKGNGRGNIKTFANGSIGGNNVSLAFLAERLSSYADRPVIDKTGFTEPIAFTLQWAPDETPADTTHPSLYTAVQEQLGLKLKPEKDPIEVLVIDHIERPTPN